MWSRKLIALESTVRLNSPSWNGVLNGQSRDHEQTKEITQFISLFQLIARSDPNGSDGMSAFHPKDGLTLDYPARGTAQAEAWPTPRLIAGYTLDEAAASESSVRTGLPNCASILSPSSAAVAISPEAIAAPKS